MNERLDPKAYFPYRISASCIKNAANEMYVSRKRGFVSINNGSFESRYSASLSDSLISLSNSIVSLVSSSTPTGIPAVVRVFLETYAKTKTFLDAFNSNEDSQKVLAKELKSEVAQYKKALRSICNAYKRTSDDSLSQMRDEAIEVIKENAAEIHEEKYDRLIHESDVCSFIEMIPNHKDNITEAVRDALLDNIAYEQAHQAKYPYSEVLYPMLCHQSHANISAVFDQTIDDDKIYRDLVPLHTYLYLEIIYWCILDIKMIWDSIAANKAES